MTVSFVKVMNNSLVVVVFNAVAAVVVVVNNHGDTNILAVNECCYILCWFADIVVGVVFYSNYCLFVKAATIVAVAVVVLTERKWL